MRSLWKGAVTFGLVHIPVKLYPATEDHDVHFRQLHRSCRTPVRYRRWCPTCDREAPPEEIVKGYEWAPGEFVDLEVDDLERLPLATARTVEILDFVHLEEIDPLYFERGYYLGPADGASRAYTLLRTVLAESSLAAVARVALRAKESLALLRAMAPALALETLHHPDELRPPADVDGTGQAAPPSERELEMARDLVRRLTSNWEPARYPDRYREALQQLLAERAAGGRVAVAAPGVAADDRFADLLSALEGSVRLAEERRRAAAVR